jgi:betaine-aldehyde dehydrogenase
MMGQLYINGRWTDGRGKARIPVIDPATEQTWHHVVAGSPADIASAVESAAATFERWRRTTGRERAGYLRAIAGRIAERREELARLEVMDNGKPLPEALWDIDDAAGCFSYYADLAEDLDRRQGTVVGLPDARFASKIRFEPVGVAGLIVPWNFPLLMAAWKVAPALAAGATAVLKPSEYTPITALELASIAHHVGLPAGVLNVVTGYGAEAGDALSRHPAVRKVAFTGSVPTGAKVLSNSASDIKAISLELGGKSPIVVFEDADIEAAVEWIMFGIYWNQGQVCSATSRLLVQERLAPALLERLLVESQHIPIGSGLTPGVLLGPLVGEQQRRKVAQSVDDAIADGAKLLCGGRAAQPAVPGYFISPTVLYEPPVQSPAWREEIFGPVLCVRTFKSEADAISLANDSAYGLAAAVMSKDIERCERVAAEFDAGIVWINCSQPTFTQAPWGGTKQSGIGRELGEWGLNNYLEVKQITTYRSDAPWAWYIKPA